MKLHPQSAKNRFGATLIRELDSPDCLAVECAVAWVRASGLAHLQKGLDALLKRGGSLIAVVGIDGDNTSVEGLDGFIKIVTPYAGRAKLFVRHNEAGPIFHPKVYVFRRKAELLAYVGSNNLTQSGLFQNEELSVALTCAVGDPLGKELDKYFKELVDTTSGLVKPLTFALLKQLESHGYVRKEAQLSTTLRRRAKKPRFDKPLFASSFVKPPKLKIATAAPVKPKDIEETDIVADNPEWQAVYLRLRLARGTQAQIPIAVAREIRRRIGLGSGDGVIEIKSRTDGTSHKISPASARGSVNTYKFEGVNVTGEPLLHIFPIGDELFFQFLDSADPLGAPVLKLLKDGFAADPPATRQTKTDRKTATWFRFT